MSSAPPRVLVAGFPDGVASFLARQLRGATVETAADAGAACAELARGEWSLLLLDGEIPGGGADGVLRAGAPAPPTFLCLPRGGGAPRADLQALGVTRTFFHPLDRQALVREAAAVLGTPSASRPAAEPGAHPAAEGKADALADAVRQAWERFRGPVTARVDAIEAAAIALLEGGLDEETRRHAEREAHKLAGSVGTFGFAQGSRLAREVETLLQGSAPLGQAEALRLSDAAVALRRELARPPSPSTAPPPRARPAAERPEGEPAAPPRPLPLLLVVDADAELAERIAMEASGRGMRARVAVDVAGARVAVAEERPAAVLLDLALDREDTGTLALLADLSSHAPRVPVLVLTARSSFADRVEVARMGGVGFLQKPVAPATVVDAVEGVLQRGRQGRASVLAVDDDPLILHAVETLLTPAGVEVHTLGDPLRFWEALEEACPDAVLLDIDMPRVSGIELCRVMRNDTRWSATPVIFLTARTEAETVQRVFAEGADDYVAKPFVGPELVTRVTNRLERVQLHRALADSDPLTGVANRRRSDELMAQLVHLAVRNRQPFSLALLDLDHFKQVNDRHGHAVGDEVLRRVARLLERAFRAEDVVARWGGEEFVVGMYGMDKDDGVQRMADLLEQVRAEPFDLPGAEPLRVTFSAGIAQFPVDGADLQALYRVADATLYQAKEAGRDRVLPAGWTAERPDAAEQVDVLVVEDDHALARLLLHALETRGYGARWMEDGREAADALTGSRPRLRARVVLLDVDLPGMDGHAVLRALARDRVLERTNVIVLTVRAHEAEVVQALEEGAFDHVSKPFSVPILLQRIRRAMKM
ncbi:MAG TPA: response regulator [Longimicrobium sp.]|nr:response regulator [Longimicrobium sp.]